MNLALVNLLLTTKISHIGDEIFNSRYGYSLWETAGISTWVRLYLQRVILYCEANEIDAKKQAAVLLSSSDAPIYTLVSDLLAPSTPGETLEELY